MAETAERQEYFRLLRQSFLLRGCSEEAAALLAAGARSLAFVKGQVIFGQGQNQDCLGLLLRGRAKAVSGETLLRGFAKGDIFGAAALFAAAGEPFSLIVTESAGEALLLPLPAVRQLLASESAAAENYIRFLSQRIVFLNRKIGALSGGEAHQRLAAQIAALSGPDSLGRPVFSGNISRLAASLGISRASLYRALGRLEQQNLLHREGRSIVIDDLPRLKEYKTEVSL